MPIHDLGYRTWRGEYSGTLFRFWVIASNGICVVGRNTWVRRALLAAWLPTFGLAAIIFGYERLLENRQIALTPADVRGSILGDVSGGLQDGDVVIEALMQEDLREGRHRMWSWLLSTFLRVPQAVMATLLIGMIAPPLISRDVRTRAFLIYFSKPIGAFEYVLGKMLIVTTYLISITTVPALGCYCFGVALSSDLSVLADTWDLPFRIVLASLVFIIPAVSVSLMFSSLTSESRFAAFAWFAVWGLGFIAWNVTYGVMSGDAQQKALAQRAEQQALYNSQDDFDESVDRGLIDPAETFVPPLPPALDAHLTEEQRAAFERQRTEYDRMLREARTSGLLDQGQRQLAIQLAEAQNKIARHPMSLISLYDTLVRLQRWVFGLETEWSAVLPSIVVTVLVTVLAWFILLKKVSAPIRV